MKLVIDIETDSLNPTVIHCLSSKQVGVDEVKTFTSPVGLQEYLNSFDKIIAHNGVGFDFPALAKVWDVHVKFEQMVDTLILSMMENPSREGGHSLKSWGERIRFNKIEYKGNFTESSKELITYCEQDTRLCEKVYTVLLQSMENFSEKSIEDEHRMRIVADRISRKGFKINRNKTVNLFNKLMTEQDLISVECKNLFPDEIVKRVSEKTGKPLKDKVIKFNPASRKQIGEKLVNLGWKPKVFTETGLPKVDETTLKDCRLDVAEKLARYFLLQNRTSQIKSWLELCSEEERVHCQYRTLGAITNRMSSIKPNLQQIPSVRVEYGEECREVWEAKEGNKLIDTDAASLELRVLAHYMNDKKFTEEVLHGDIHTANQKMAGLETRPQAKTFIYALLYGAGDAKIGSVVGGTFKDGALLRSRFMANLPTFKRLSEAVQNKGRLTGKLKAIDGRILRVRHPHASLNTLIQGSSAVLMKKWFMLTDHHVRRKCSDANIVAMVHDELVLESCEKDVALVSGCVKMSISQVNKSYNLRCRLDCDIQIGNNWSEIH